MFFFWLKSVFNKEETKTTFGFGKYSCFEGQLHKSSCCLGRSTTNKNSPIKSVLTVLNNVWREFYFHHLNRMRFVAFSFLFFIMFFILQIFQCRELNYKKYYNKWDKTWFYTEFTPHPPRPVDPAKGYPNFSFENHIIKKSSFWTMDYFGSTSFLD